MTFEIRKATKKQAKARIGFVAPSGAGKTYSSLILATELAQGGKIVLIDTENRSSEKYADIFDFDILEFDAPYTPQRYVEAIQYRRAERRRRASSSTACPTPGPARAAPWRWSTISRPAPAPGTLTWPGGMSPRPTTP